MKNLPLKLFAIILLAGFFHACNETLVEEQQPVDDLELKSAGIENGLVQQINPLSIPDDERFLVGFTSTPDVNLIKSVGGSPYRIFSIVPAIAARLNPKAVEALSKNPKIEYIEPDYKVFATAQSVPWGISRVFGDETYQFETWTFSTGTGRKVAILDTGIDTDHEDLTGTVDGGTNTVGGPSYEDGNGHGTHVAGTVAALDNNIGVVGVTKDVDLYAVKVLDDSGGGTVSSVAGGIEWAANNGMHIINMSLGSSSSSQTLQDACNNAYGKGVLIVSSAGNSGNPGGGGNNVGYPGAYESVIAVAASTQNDTRASFSSTGPAVELIAPGYQVLSTIPDNGYDTYSGTSMASPHVAGVSALTWAANTTLSNVDVRMILRETAEDLGLSAEQQGYGLARADLAVTAARGGTTPTNDPPLASFTYSATDLKVDFTDQSTDSDGSIASWAWNFGDGTTSTAQNPSHSYTAGGTYPVTLTVTDDGGATDTATKDVTVSSSSGNVAPAVTSLSLTNTSNPAWTRTSVSWAVSDDNGNLQTVLTELYDPSGKFVDSATTSVSGSSASGSNELGQKGGPSGEYKVVITVTDSDGLTGTKEGFINL